MSLLAMRLPSTADLVLIRQRFLRSQPGKNSALISSEWCSPFLSTASRSWGRVTLQLPTPPLRDARRWLTAFPLGTR